VTEGSGKSIIRRCLADEAILQTDPLEQLPDDNRPDDKHIAARLKIPHEFRTRLAARVQRKLKRKRKHGFYNPGDEVWMHLRPRGDDLREYRLKRALTQQHLTCGHQNGSVKESDKDDDGDHGTGDEATSKQALPENTSQECWLGRRPLLCAADSEH
jgi:platelet-activating factor acetylhydrolase